jgi:5'-nucleotidase / UDP-sugar diphosphatase
MKMIRYFVILVVGLLLFSGTTAQTNPDKKLIILHTNDLHSRLNGFASEVEYTPLSQGDDNTKGGFARIASLIRSEQEKSRDNLLVVDAGDFLMGTFFTRLEESTGFQLSLMKKMGYDVVSLGNHEFDYGPVVLAKIIGKSAENGAVPLMVASNLSFSGKESDDDAMKLLFDKKIIQPYRIIEKNGLKLGIFGLLGYSAINDAPLARPLVFEDPVKTAKKYARLLKLTEKVDLVICISHSGIEKDKEGNWAGEDVVLAKKVPEIDVIIGGHSHTLLTEPVIVNGIPIVQTGSYGTGLGRLELDFNQGKIQHIDSKVIPVNDAIAGDPEIQKAITSQEQLVSEHILKPLNLTYSTVVTETNFPLVCQEDTLLEKSNLGLFVTDAIYAYVNKHTPPGSDVTLFPAGLIFDNILPNKTGKQSVADIFRVVPMGSGKDNVPGYPLARIWVTGKELKGIMEILYLAPSSSKDNYIYFGGLRASYNPKKGLLKKITSIETGDPEKGFTPLDWSKKNRKLYSLTADSYVLEFVGLIKKLSMHLIKVSLKNEKGEIIQSVSDAIIDGDPVTPGIQEVKEWMALLWFLGQQPDNNSDGIPEIPDYYRKVTSRLYEGGK